MAYKTYVVGSADYRLSDGGLHAVRQTLDTVEDLLLQNDDHSRLLWSILTALRGPDLAWPVSVKEVTTAPLRSRIFPRVWKQLREKYVFDATPNDSTRISNGAAYADPDALTLAIFHTVSSTSDHFESHLEKAMDAVAILAEHSS